MDVGVVRNGRLATCMAELTRRGSHCVNCGWIAEQNVARCKRGFKVVWRSSAEFLFELAFFREKGPISCLSPRRSKQKLRRTDFSLLSHNILVVLLFSIFSLTQRRFALTHALASQWSASRLAGCFWPSTISLSQPRPPFLPLQEASHTHPHQHLRFRPHSNLIQMAPKRHSQLNSSRDCCEHRSFPTLAMSRQVLSAAC